MTLTRGFAALRSAKMHLARKVGHFHTAKTCQATNFHCDLFCGTGDHKAWFHQVLFKQLGERPIEASLGHISAF